MTLPEKNKTVILVAGPTASGKTTLAIELAAYFQTEIISADSRQCFKELNIGVARPSKKELVRVKHHFIASHSIHEEVTAATFEQFALQRTEELFQQHDIIVMVGGSGLYIKAFFEGLDIIPAIDPAVREQIMKNYLTDGLSWLQKEIQQKDPEFYKKGEIQNPQRIMRSLEVVESTGKSIFSFRNRKKEKRNFNAVKIGLGLSKEQLQKNIHSRTDKMMEAGLLHEVESLKAHRQLNALQTVGYEELYQYMDDAISLEKAVDRIKTNTAKYAKRQITWFKKDNEIKWFAPEQRKEIINLVLERK